MRLSPRRATAGSGSQPRSHRDVARRPPSLERRCCEAVIGNLLKKIPRQLVLLRQESGTLADLLIGELQQGHLGSVLVRATMRRLRTVAIELGMCRSGRIGGASGSVTLGNGRSRELRGET